MLTSGWGRGSAAWALRHRRQPISRRGPRARPRSRRPGRSQGGAGTEEGSPASGEDASCSPPFTWVSGGGGVEDRPRPAGLVLGLGHRLQS
eukprot:9493387-Pyramimonas_sp.AAC.1